MLVLHRFLQAIFVLTAISSPAFADTPLLTVQSSSSIRLIQVIQELGLPDPIEAAGLETESTLNLLQGTIDLKSTSGGFVFFNDDRPHLILCIPLLKPGVALNELPTFAGAKFIKDANNVYQLDGASRFFAKQAKAFLLFGDSQEFIDDAEAALDANPWSKVTEDIKIRGDLRNYIPIQRGLLTNEVVSILSTKPKTELLLNLDSIKEHVRVGLQSFLIKSILECNEFEMTLNQSDSGDLNIAMSTIENRTVNELASNLRFISIENPTCLIDLATKLAPSSVADTISWTKSKEKEILDAISDESVSDVSDLKSTQKIVRLLSEIVRQSVSNQSLDGGILIGNKEGSSYLAGGLMMSNGAKLGTMFQEVIDICSEFGLVCHDLRTTEERSQTGSLNVAIEVPESANEFGLKLSKGTRLHLSLAENRLWCSIGSPTDQTLSVAERLSQGGQDYPLNIICDLDAGTELGSSAENVLPLGYRRMQMTVSKTDQGRRYETKLSNRAAKSKDTAGPLASRAD